MFALPPGSAGHAAERDPLWAPPLEVPFAVAGPYLAPPNPYGSGHRGIDLAARPGDAVLAPEAGTVSFVGRVVDRAVISVRVDDVAMYSMEPVRSGLAKGDRVRRGERIGTVAEGGHCAAECLHLGVRVSGDYISPMRYFLRRPVLLPW